MDVSRHKCKGATLQLHTCTGADTRTTMLFFGAWLRSAINPCRAAQLVCVLALATLGATKCFKEMHLTDAAITLSRTS